MSGNTAVTAAATGMALNNSVLADLAAVNRPAQWGLLEHVVSVLSISPAVSHLLVRGSLARGTADRMSDVDCVVGIADGAYAEFVTVRDALATTALGAILPGWPDTIVGLLGGLGYVYLVEHDGGLHQLDLYLVPASLVPQVLAATNAHLLLQRPVSGNATGDVAEVVRRELARPADTATLLVEVLVLGQMIKKRLARGQHFIAYAEYHLLTTAVKNLVKAALAPTSRFYGWYQLADEVGTTPIGRACLRDLGALIAAPAIPTADTLVDALNRVLALVQRAAPDTVERLRPAVDAYWHYLDLA